ncbi:MAG: hypothetical protein KGJ80_12855, partial [Chloroflexota bacterium]|nr:hypothetical protein [Chloroflexota bacterium]
TIEERRFEMAQAREPHKHGILYLHGAGLPEDQKTLIGDPLATVADGLVDHFEGDPFISQRCRMAAKTDEVKDRATEALELDVFIKGEDGKSDQHEHRIRIDEVLWKPLAPPQSLSTYLPLVWQWAFAFQSNFQRQSVLKKYSRRKQEWRQAQSARTADAASEKAKPNLADIYADSKSTRHDSQMWSRIWLAVLGLPFTLLIWIPGELYKRQSVMQLKLEWLTTDQVTTGIVAISLFAAVLLVLLAIQEKLDNDAQPPKPHSPLFLFAIVLTSAWLSIFLLPILLILYYLDRMVTLLIALVLATVVIFVALNGGDWVTRGVLLSGIAVGVAIGIGLLSLLPIKTFLDRLLSFFRRNMQYGLVNLITTLIVTGGAPWVILLIAVLEWLSFLPLIGDNLEQLANAISEAGLWQAVKDIYVILTDSSRSAVVRCTVEEAIVKLDKAEVDSIHIFAHSLGTVVAYDTLVQIGQGNGVFIKQKSELYNKIKTLVTFGCPLNKIRTLAQFHSADVLSGFDYDRFDTSARLPGDLGSGDFRWVNVYSSHDIVSDACVAYSEPTDLVHPREFTAWSAHDIATAHGIYWIDPGFWNTALEALGIVYPRGEMIRIEELPTPELRGHSIEELRERGIVTKAQLEAQLGASAEQPTA